MRMHGGLRNALRAVYPHCSFDFVRETNSLEILEEHEKTDRIAENKAVTKPVQRKPRIQKVSTIKGTY